MEVIKTDWPSKVVIGFFSLISLWWIYIFLNGIQDSSINYFFGATYGLIAAWGGIWGITIAKRWGGMSSLIGKATIFLSLGLLAQEFGQLVFSFYNIFLHVEIPYPSIADIGYFGSVLLYIYAIFLLSKASGLKFSLRNTSYLTLSILVPILMLVISYMFFLRDYEFDFTNPLVLLLDFGYPMGEAIYISIAIITFNLSRTFLGGMMRKKVMFILIAFIAQYIAEYNFLFQNSRGTWVNGGYGDYLYFIAYTLMVIGLFQLRGALKKLSSET